MKNLRLVTILVFAVCVFSLVMAQSDRSKPKEWTYKGSNGSDDDKQRQTITIVITQGPKGYEVSGELKGGQREEIHYCKFRGLYYPAGQRITAKCFEKQGPYVFATDITLTGEKMPDKDIFRVTWAYTLVGFSPISDTLYAKRADSSGVRVVDEFGNLVGIIASKPADSASSGAGDETPKAKGQPCCEYDVGGGDWRCSSDYNKSQCEGGMGFKGTYFADGKSCVAPFPNSINGHCK